MDPKALIDYLSKTLNMSSAEAASLASRMSSGAPFNPASGASAIADGAAVKPEPVPSRQPWIFPTDAPRRVDYRQLQRPQTLTPPKITYEDVSVTPTPTLDIGDVSVQNVPPVLDISDVSVQNAPRSMDIGDVSVKNRPLLRSSMFPGGKPDLSGPGEQGRTLSKEDLDALIESLNKKSIKVGK